MPPIKSEGNEIDQYEGAVGNSSECSHLQAQRVPARQSQGAMACFNHLDVLKQIAANPSSCLMALSIARLEGIENGSRP